MNPLIVHLHGRRGGVLKDDGRRMVFRYDAAWLADTGALPLSRQLPLQSEPLEDQGVNVFFGGLLPEADAIGNPLALPELQNEIIRHRVTQRAEKMLEHLDKIKGEISPH